MKDDRFSKIGLYGHSSKAKQKEFVLESGGKRS
jgi:hypothetical protein